MQTIVFKQIYPKDKVKQFRKTNIENGNVLTKSLA